MKLGCGIIILWILSGCAANDHSRNFNQTVRCDGDIYISTEVLLEKSGVEESNSDADGTLDLPLTGIL